LETEAAASYGFYERIHTCTAQSIPEADGTFDYVISNSVLEHIPDLEGAIAEVGRLLRPGGRFYFTGPGPGFRANLKGSILPGASRERYLDDLDRRLAHVHYLSSANWHAMAGRHGLVVDSANDYLDKRETRRWENLSRATGGLLHSLSFGRKRPIEIQRALKIRALQNRMPMPRPVARAIAKMIETPESENFGSGSCLLVMGHRPR
jgi:SAM-dependent methyltransferase